jgi:type I restriction enzyme, S subunit
MNAELFLTHFERIADTHDAVQRLRRFILDLAVRGKLVPQQVPWQTLKIESCLEALSDGRFIHQGWSPQCESHPSPDRKVWGVLKTTAIQDGFFLDNQNKELPGKLTPKPLLEVGAGDILITCAGPRARCGIACLVKSTRERLIISGKMYRFRANPTLISREYLELFLRSGEAQAAINLMKTGSSESGLNLTQDRFRDLEIRFGNLSEQHRIVTKVNELMALCDRLELARENREDKRDQLTAASLAHLNTPDPETFHADSRFALEALAAITTRPDHIKQLRQSILNLAVRGKLIEQDAVDESATVLLRNLRQRADEKSKSRVSLGSDQGMVDIPYECPAGWVWTTVQQILDPKREISYGVIKLGDEPKKGGISTLRCSDVRPGFINLSGVRKVHESIEADYARTRLMGGEIVINIRGTLGGVALVSKELSGFNVAREVAVVPISETLCGPFFVYLMLSSYFWNEIQKNLRGIAYKGLNLGILRELPVPIPPRAEQHRIVAKIDALMALCDQLEASLISTAATRRRLLDALLAEALAPVDALELEAAE